MTPPAGVTMQPVTSAAMKAVGHDPASNTLWVQFPSGKHYSYPDVSAGEHSALMSAPSLGKHFNQHHARKR
jgi:hypothetical protein